MILRYPTWMPKNNLGMLVKYWRFLDFYKQKYGHFWDPRDYTSESLAKGIL